jgi:DNA-binding NarL/FixJ family response regulator
MNEDVPTIDSVTRAVIADGEPTVRRALRDLSIQGLGMQVVGEAASGAVLETLVRRLQPDLVIVAWNLVAASAGALLDGLRRSCGGLRIVVLGLRPETRGEALATGADAYVCMVDAPAVVSAALRPGHESTEFPAAKRRMGSTGGEKTHEPGSLS